MHVALTIVALALGQQVGSSASAPRLNVRAERGLGGIQSDGWQHIALRLENSSGQPIAGHATLYEIDSQAGARPRIVLPFTVTNPHSLHFYPFRPPETTPPSSYVITLEDDLGRPIPFDGGTQIVIRGQSTRAIRVDMGNGPAGEFRVAILGDNSPFLKAFVNEWTLPFDEILRSRSTTSAQWQRLSRSSNRITPEATTLEDPRLFPDSYVGYGDLRVLFVVGIDLDQSLTERQRRALDDWVNSGGVLLFVPRKQQHLVGPFMRELIGVQSRGEVTTVGDQHLRLASDAGPSHQIVHFLTALEPDRPMEVLASYESQPVIYSVAAGYGRVWVVAFDPESHGGLRRYKPIWTEILNRIAKREFTEGLGPTSMASHPWSAESDHKWLATLSERFGKFPSVEHLAILILFYLLVVGPANFFLLKRREARVWLIGTVPVLAVIFGGIVLSMGYLSHGLRAATNYLALAVVNPEGDRSFSEEYVAVYGTTSAEYQLEFPKNLPVRPLAEFVPNPNGGFENPSSFKLQAREERQWLRDWRLTFWQTRGATSLDCTMCGGRLTARQANNEIAIYNGTEISFEHVMLVSGVEYGIGPVKPFETVKLGSGRSAESSEATWPNDESRVVVEAAINRLRTPGGDWVFGLTRQPIHSVRSPDTPRHLGATIYAWPVVSLGTAPSPVSGRSMQ
jgi:hypothetical protein